MSYIAGIVLFNPEIDRLVDNIEAIYKQVDKLLLVDNDSKNIEVIERMVANYANCILIKNKKIWELRML